MGTLIDSSILVAVDRGTLELEDLLRSYPGEKWFLSAVTVSEMLHGGLRAISPVQRARRLTFTEDKIRRFQVLDFDLAAARMHAEIWVDLARRGYTVGERDLIIAATARAHDYAVATRDLRSFPRIPNLKVINL